MSKGEDKSADGIFTGGKVEIQFLTGEGLPDKMTKEPLAVLQVNLDESKIKTVA